MTPLWKSSATPMLVLGMSNHEVQREAVDRWQTTKSWSTWNTASMSCRRSMSPLLSQLSVDLLERRRRQNEATIQDMLLLNKMIRSAMVIECKLKIRSIPMNHVRFVEYTMKHMPKLREEHHNRLM